MIWGRRVWEHEWNILAPRPNTWERWFAWRHTRDSRGRITSVKI